MLLIISLLIWISINFGSITQITLRIDRVIYSYLTTLIVWCLLRFLVLHRLCFSLIFLTLERSLGALVALLILIHLVLLVILVWLRHPICLVLIFSKT